MLLRLSAGLHSTQRLFGEKPDARNLFLLVIPPEEPAEGDLGAQDGEEEGEEAVTEVVEPGGVDDEDGGDREGSDYEEEGDAQQERAEEAPDGAVRSGLSRLVRAGWQLRQSCLLAVFSEEVVLFSVFFSEAAGFSSDPPFFAASVFAGPFL